MDARLLLALRPPSCCILGVLPRRRHWGLSRWRLVQLPPLRDRAASDQGPGHLAVLTGPSMRGGPSEPERTNTARTATSDARCTQRTCQPGTYGW